MNPLSTFARSGFAVRLVLTAMVIGLAPLQAAFSQQPDKSTRETITVEELGVAQREARLRGYVLSYGTRDYPPRWIFGFDGGDGTWVVNFQDGSSRKATGPGFDQEYAFWPSVVGPDGKVFVAGYSQGGLMVFDPVADSIMLIHPIPNARWLRGMAIGADGAVYVSDYPTGSAARYDPATGEVTNYGRQGGPFAGTHAYGYSVGSDGRYVYTASGKVPWYVVAYDTQTGKQQNLLEFDSTDHPEVLQRGKEVFLEVERATNSAKLPTQYRLAGGRVEPVAAIPRFDDSNIAGRKLPQPKPLGLGRNLRLVDGGAALEYQPAGSEETKQLAIPVTGVEMDVERIVPLHDGRLLLSAGPYGNVYSFDPKSRAYTDLGSPAAKHVYDMLPDGDDFYFCGYPNAVFGKFDSTAAKLLGDWYKNVGSKHALYLVRGADGRIYSGNHAEREFVGGSLGWYDPRTEVFGGIRFPNDDCECMTTARDGRLIVYASDFSHDPAHPEIEKYDGRLIIYDTAKREVVRQFSPLSDGSAGVIVEVKPGIVLGFGRHEKRPVMYLADVDAGRVLKQADLPAVAYRHCKLGPDGKVYAFVAGSLLRVDPETLTFETICKSAPGRMAFIGNDLYIAGLPQLRRIINVTGETNAEP